MELVRKIQASFYQDEAVSVSTLEEEGRDGTATQWLHRDPENPTVIDNLPLWRVQWTEMIGYQNVLNVHVPHYTHMFRQLVLQHPRPWFYGHVHLPGGSENLNNPTYRLPDAEGPRGPGATLTGTLMQITDYATQEDGRLTLVVQGVGRIEVVEARQHVPYAVARVKLVPDREAFDQYVWPIVGTTPMGYELSMALLAACQDVAAREADLYRDLEYRGTKCSPVNALVEGVSPLSNINGTTTLDLGQIREELGAVFAAGLAREAVEVGSDEILLASSTCKLWDHSFLYDLEDVIEMESCVWIELDRMISLLQRAQPDAEVPVPSQVLGLLPTDVDWPREFRLSVLADKLEAEETYVGTHSKSPFVRLSRKYAEYPLLRRAERLSYVIWVFLPVAPAVDQQVPMTQQVLETLSVVDRLKMADAQLKILNKGIESLLGR